MDNLLDYIPEGQANAIHRSELVELLGVGDDTAREKVRELA